MPQIWTNWRRHDSQSLSPMFFLCWTFAGVPLGVYNIAADYNIALQIQPNILIFLSLVTWSQCKYYGARWSLHKIALSFLAMVTTLGGGELGLVLALRLAHERGQDWTFTVMAIVAAVFLAAGVLRHYVDAFKTRSDAGLSLKFAFLDAGGDLASLLSVLFEPHLSVLGLVIYGSELVIWLGLIGIVVYFRMRSRRKVDDGEDRSFG